MSWQLVFAQILSIALSLSGISLPLAMAADITCDCAPSVCAACEVETGTTFYSAKCGPQNARVKSCKKATCEAVENQKQCLALLKDARPVELKGDGAGESLRQVANLAPEAGQIVDLEGDYRVTHANGIAEKPRKKDPAFVGDLFETDEGGRVRVILRDGSELTIAAQSKLKIEAVDVDAANAKRKVAMMVLAGKVRNRVSRQYKDGNSYQVRTPTAVAGVRGTDFITSYLPRENGSVTEVRTIEGLVRLSNLDSVSPKFIDVPAETYAVFETDGSTQQLSPLYRLKEEELRQLRVQDFAAVASTGPRPSRRVPASTESEPVCSTPKAAFNQCSFTCENNPVGEKRCRTDLTNVACVRRICRANGQWAEEKRLPSSEGEKCEASGTVSVGSCGAYW